MSSHETLDGAQRVDQLASPAESCREVLGLRRGEPARRLPLRIHRVLEELPEHERELIELAYWSELSQSEIAARLSIPLGTVKRRTRSALSRLAELLEHEGEDG